MTRTIKTRKPRILLSTTAESHVDHVVKKRAVDEEDRGQNKERVDRSLVDHLLKKQDVGDREMKINERKFGIKRDIVENIGRPLGHLAKKPNVADQIGGRKSFNDGGLGGRGDVNARILGRLRSVVDENRHRCKRQAVDTRQLKPMDKNNLEARFAGEILPCDASGPRANRRKRFNIGGGSHGEYVSKGAKDKAYRSYEDYAKKTAKECPEDRVCRLFKEEMVREDSFDGWNPHWN